jgi:hypothetical protein
MALLCVYLDRVSGTLSMQSADEMLKMPCNALSGACRCNCSGSSLSGGSLVRSLTVDGIVALEYGPDSSGTGRKQARLPLSNAKKLDDAAWSRLSRPNLPAGTA